MDSHLFVFLNGYSHALKEITFCVQQGWWKLRMKSKYVTNPSIFNMISWFARMPGQKTHQTCVWCSKYYFFFIISYILWALKTLYNEKIKKWIETLFSKNFARNKKKYLEHQAVPWSMSLVSRRPIEPAYYIEDWRIFGNFLMIGHAECINENFICSYFR